MGPSAPGRPWGAGASTAFEVGAMDPDPVRWTTLRLVAPTGAAFRWTGGSPLRQVAMLLAGVRTHSGLEGYGGLTLYGPTWDVARLAAQAMERVIGCSPAEVTRLAAELMTAYAAAPRAAAVWELALWDATARALGVPLHACWGAVRDRLPAYASTPTYGDPEEYHDALAQLQAQGFRAAKLHVWGDPARDRALCEAVRARLGDDFALMLDAEGAYSRSGALEVGRALDTLRFTWFEMPLPDEDQEGYRGLADALHTPVLPGGNTVVQLDRARAFLESQAWDALRTDATLVGPSAARGWLRLAAEFKTTCELQSYGSPPSQLANLHLMLAGGSTYFEAPVPLGSFDFGGRAPRPDADGAVAAPDGPGLGLDLEPDANDRATVARWEGSTGW